MCFEAAALAEAGICGKAGPELSSTKPLIHVDCPSRTPSEAPTHLALLSGATRSQSSHWAEEGTGSVHISKLTRWDWSGLASFISWALGLVQLLWTLARVLVPAHLLTFDHLLLLPVHVHRDCI